MAVQFKASEVNPDITVLSLSGRLGAEAVEAATPVARIALEQSPAGMVIDLCHELELDVVHNSLVHSTASHWQEFIGAWQRPGSTSSLPL